MIGGVNIASFRKTWRVLSEKLELPEDAFGFAPRVQMFGKRIIVSGCKKLLKYQSDEIVILCSDSVVSIFGEHLKCMYFFEGTVEICGEIFTVCFEDR